MLRRISTITLLILLIGAGKASAFAESPKQALRRTQTKINRLLQVKAKKGSAKDKKVRAKLTKAINSFLDFSELARRSLSKHWDKRSEQERTEFTDILRELIERNYVKQLRGNLGYKLQYGDQAVKGDKASVSTTVKVVKDRRTTEVVIEYRMTKTPSGWMVYDVITDEVSIVRNYRSQFNRIIRRKSYDHLVKKMRRKIKELGSNS
jgi:phospholipid transport system substrate-binding protein